MKSFLNNESLSIDHEQANNLTYLIISFYKQRTYFFCLCLDQYNFLIYFYLDNLFLLPF